jgi:YesN/AraC family two-component response regulator
MLKYLHRLRVEAAKRIIETKSYSFDEIAYQVGYENSSFFRKVFTELCHISPKIYRTKWGKVNFPDSSFQVQATT